MAGGRTVAVRDSSALEIATDSWNALVTALERMPLLFLFAFLLHAAAALFLWKGVPSIYAWLPDSGLSETNVAAVKAASQTGVFAANTFALTFVALAIYGLVLHDETLDAAGLLRMRTLRLAGWMAAGVIFSSIAGGLVIAPWFFTEKLSSAAVAGLCAGGVVLALGCVPFTLAFPAVADDAPGRRLGKRLAASWRQSQGLYLRLCGSILVALLPYFIFVALFDSGNLIAAYFVNGEMSVRSVLSPDTDWVQLLFNAVTALAKTALFAAVLAGNYRLAKAREVVAKV